MEIAAFFWERRYCLIKDLLTYELIDFETQKVMQKNCFFKLKFSLFFSKPELQIHTFSSIKNDKTLQTFWAELSELFKIYKVSTLISFFQ